MIRGIEAAPNNSDKACDIVKPDKSDKPQLYTIIDKPDKSKLEPCPIFGPTKPCQIIGKLPKEA